MEFFPQKEMQRKEKRNKRKQFSYNGLILGLINHSHSDVDDENNLRDYNFRIGLQLK
jgi:hypothetical protein